MSTHTMEALGSRLAAARGMLGEALQDSRNSMLERGSEGLDGARSLGLEALQGARRGSKAAGRVMSGHPWETLLLASVAGVAIGWIVRHAWSTNSTPARATRVPRARTATAKAARKN